MRKKTPSNKKNTSSAALLSVRKLSACVRDVEILHGITLAVKPGTTHVLMGPNGSGKSTLLNAIIGHPRVKCTSGSIIFDGKNMKTRALHERARAGIFLAFQHPVEISGVAFNAFVRSARHAVHPLSTKEKPEAFISSLKERAHRLEFDERFLGRSVNEGFSGGEKKKGEILQMMMLAPKLALLDEIDSGLDVDALRVTLSTLRAYQKESGIAYLLVTHQPSFLHSLIPDHVHVISRGRIVASGGVELARTIEKKGYEALIHTPA